MSIWQRMGYPGPRGAGIALTSAALASMVAFGLFTHFRTKKKWSGWKAGAAAGASAAGIGAGVQLGLSMIQGGNTAGLVAMQPVRGLSMRRLGLLSSQRIGQMPTVVAGLTAEKLSGGCAGCRA